MAAEMIVDIEKRLSASFALQTRFLFEMASSHVLILFGPSGSGKTTVLRLVWPAWISRTVASFDSEMCVGMTAPKE